ncbi:hypothetical protein [Streptomyces sp. NPDC058545]|uniref:hypothetical protein n=1 Tax=Streptomyces sp. NPDC058545 TaxID=3346544 RepID=UPI0036629872
MSPIGQVVPLTTAVISTAACSDDEGSASSTASEAASVVGEKLNGFKNGVNAKGDVNLGAVATDHEGRATSEIVVTNGTDASSPQAVQVNFSGATATCRTTWERFCDTDRAPRAVS